MSLLVISSSLNPDSNSRKLAVAAVAAAEASSTPVQYVDLREKSLPICDGAESFEHPELDSLKAQIGGASAIILSGPVYAYGMAASTKNLIELTGRAWTGKPVGLMAAAGGSFSYMAVLGLANTLMLDYRCPIIPKYVYATGSDFDAEGQGVADTIESRIAELVRTVVHWGSVL
ncbi:MAG: NADPH-dependent FMN reductase [Puniceicoccaceae bacterium]